MIFRAYVNDGVNPKRTSYVHPSGPPSGPPSRPLIHTIERPDSAPTPRRPYTAPVDHLSIRSTSTMGPSFAQQLYASSLKKPASDDPPALTSRTPNEVRENHDSNPHQARPRIAEYSGSIDLDAPAPPPVVSSVSNVYPAQLSAYLATSNKPTNYSSPNDHQPVLSGAGPSQSPAPPVAPSGEPSRSLQPSEQEPPRPTMSYNSTIRPQNPHGPHGPRAASRPSSLQDPRPIATQTTSPDTASAPPQQTNFPPAPNALPHRTQSYQPPPTQTSTSATTSHPRSSTFSGGAPLQGPHHASTIATPPVPAHSPPPKSTPTLHSPTLPAQVIQSRPSPISHHHPGGPSSTVQGHPPMNLSTVVRTAYTASPSNTSSFLPTPGPMPSTTSQPSTPLYSPPSPTPQAVAPLAPVRGPAPSNHFPPTPGLMPSTTSQPPTPHYSPPPPTPQAVAPLAPVRGPAPSNQQVAKSRGIGRNMFGLAAGAAAGIIGGAVLNDVLNSNNNGDGLDGIVDGIGNMMSSGNDNSDNGGLIDGVFGGGGDGGDGSYDPSQIPDFSDPSASQEYPYFDPNQNGDTSYDPNQYTDPSQFGNPYYDGQNNSYFPPPDQSDNNPYYGDPSSQGDNNGGMYQGYDGSNDQGNNDGTYYNQPQSNNGPHRPNATGLMHTAQQAYKIFGHNSGGNSGHPAVAHSIQPGSVQHPPAHPTAAPVHHNTYPGYQAAHNAYHNPAAHAPTGSHSQQPPQSHGGPQLHPQMHQAHPQAQHAPGQAHRPQAPHRTQTTPSGSYGVQHPYMQQAPTQQHAQPHAAPASQQHGFKVDPTQVKRFAKGALLAGSLLAKLNGVNLGTNNNNLNN